MKYKIQFMDNTTAAAAFDNISCTRVRLGSAVCVDTSVGTCDNTAEMLVKYKGYTETLNNFDENELSENGVV